MVKTTILYNVLRIKEVAKGNLGKGAKHHSLLSAVIGSLLDIFGISFLVSPLVVLWAACTSYVCATSAKIQP